MFFKGVSGDIFIGLFINADDYIICIYFFAPKTQILIAKELVP